MNVQTAVRISALVFTAWIARGEISTVAQTLDGTWMATITRINPPPGTPPTFTSLHTYLPGGGVIETTSTGRTNRSVGIGDWVRTGERQFTNTIYMMRYDPGEVFAGVTRIIRNIRLAENRKEFLGVSVSELYDTDGKLIRTLRATEVGKRVELGEIPDDPGRP